MSLSSDRTTAAGFVVEPGRKSNLAPCECCGATTRIVRGFVYKAGTAHAVYLVRWSVGDKRHDAEVAVSIGGWCDADQSLRQSVALSLRQMENGPAFMVVDAAQTPWGREKELGEPMERSAVIGTPLASEVFAILDATALQDERVQGWQLSRA